MDWTQKAFGSDLRGATSEDIHGEVASSSSRCRRSSTATIELRCRAECSVLPTRDGLI